MKKGNLIHGSILAALTLGLTTTGRAAEPVYTGVASSQGWYAAANIRANFLDDARLRQVGPSTGGKMKFDPGAGFGVRGGYRFCDWFSLEGETGFTGNSISSISGASVDADLLQVPFMANAVFSVPIKYSLTPFVGVGVGGTTSVIDADHISVGNTTAFGSESTTTFAYQVFAGLNYAINSQISVGFLYNYRAVDGPRWDRGGFPIETGELRNHSFGIGATFRF